MKTVISLLLILYITTISAQEHSELCGGLESGVNPCRECNSGNIALLESDPQYKLRPNYELPLSNDRAPGYKKIILTPSRGNNKHVVCNGPGCGGIVRDAPERLRGGISTGGIPSIDSNAKAMQMFQPITDLCSSPRGLGKSNLNHKGKKMIVRPARPGRIPCKTDKPNSLTFGSGLIGYNSNTFQNQKLTTGFKNFMSKITHQNTFNGNSVKGMNKYSIFNGDNIAFGNIINKINSNNLISSSSDSSKNIFSQNSNIFNTHNSNTMATNTNSQVNNNFLSGLAKVSSSEQSNNYATNQVNTVNTGLKAELFVPVAYTTNNPNGQLINGQFSNGQSGSGQFTNAQSTNGQFNNGLFNNGQFSNSQFSTGQFNNGQVSNGQFNNGQVSNGQFNNGQVNSGQFNNGQVSSGQFNNAQSKGSQSKPPAIVNFIDPSSGDIRAMTREEFCDDKKLSYEDQEKIYKGEKQPGQGTAPIDAVSWQLYLNELLGSLMNSKTFKQPKTILEDNLTYGYKQPPVDEYKKRPPGADIPEEALHTADKPPVEFKNPMPPNVDPQSILNKFSPVFKPREPPKNQFVPQSASALAGPTPLINRASSDDVPCGVIGPALPDYRPGIIIPVDGSYEDRVSTEYSEGNYHLTQQNYGQSIINSGYLHGDHVNGESSDPNHQHAVTCTCV